MNGKFVKYILKRILMAVVTIFCVITITFWAMQAIPGGPFLSEKSPSPEVLAQLNKLYGLDLPVGQQYLNYLKNSLIWNFGYSIKDARPVNEIIQTTFPVSAEIGIIALLVSIVVGVFLGSLAATHQNKLGDRLIMVLSTASVAMPSFVIAFLLLLVFAINLKWFPTLGTKPGGLVLPIVTLSLYPAAYITRLTRSSTLDVLNQDYIRTARAKGLSNSKVLFKHALRNSLTPVLTYVGPEFAYIITGSLVVEQIFSIPGIGRKFVESITNRDYPLIMGTTVFLTYIMVFMLLLTDILYKVLNPKVELD
ncbi:MAG: ABC transporter permease [Bacilli bacterium]|jgi:oligopeptide transport system permease protein|nr:ABC transporter permease [Bacilli bacterium]